MSFILPSSVITCIKTIENHGFEAWCVGGAVRDHIMNVTPGDYDVTTNALPDDIISIFDKNVPTGIKHGTVTVIIDDTSIEVTTYRTENTYYDHRKPDSVNFITDIKNDLMRRDFTMNAICYHPIRGIYDPLNGVNDINNRIIKAVGNPLTRFEEDALRIIRAFRFSCQLGFNIEKETFNAALLKVNNLNFISVERIAVELKKAFLSNSPQNMSPLFESGHLNFITNKKCKIAENISSLPLDFSLRFALFCNNENLDCLSILNNLKFDNKTKNNTKKYTEILKMPCFSETDIRRILSVSNKEQTENIICTFYPNMLKSYKNVVDKNDAYSITMLKINGERLTEIGFSGKKIGDALDFLLNKVIENPSLNNENDLIKLLEQIK